MSNYTFSQFNPNADLLILNKFDHTYSMVKDILLPENRDALADILDDQNLKCYYDFNKFYYDLQVIHPDTTPAIFEHYVLIYTKINNLWHSTMSKITTKHYNTIYKLLLSEY